MERATSDSVEMNRDRIKEIFGRASTLKSGNFMENDWAERRSQSGAKNFKRRALGFCGRETVKSIDEIAKLLQDTGIVKSVEEGKELVPSLNGVRVYYTDDCRAIDIYEVQDIRGNKAYKIQYGDFSAF
ncbi:MAG: hypothetical protein AABX94_00725 [Nanoarchaeota archaeon]